MNNEAKIMDMFYRSETKPRIRERLISREQYLEFLEGIRCFACRAWKAWA